MVKEIRLTRGLVTFVDDEDYAWARHYLWSAWTSKIGYTLACRWVSHGYGKRVRIYLHRQIMGFPEDLEVDHADRDTLNNTRANLRLATREQNNFNRKFKKQASGKKGVYPLPSGRFIARIRFGDQRVNLGSFDTAEEAASAYDEAARKYHGEFAATNVVQTNAGEESA